MNKKNRKGFTIVELVIVIAVIGILATVLVPTFGNVISDAKEKSALQAAKNIYTNYVSEHVADEGYTTEKVFVKSGEYTFECNNGNLKKADLPTTGSYILLEGNCTDSCTIADHTETVPAQGGTQEGTQEGTQD